MKILYYPKFNSTLNIIESTYSQPAKHESSVLSVNISQIDKIFVISLKKGYSISKSVLLIWSQRVTVQSTVCFSCVTLDKPPTSLSYSFLIYTKAMMIHPN